MKDRLSSSDRVGLYITVIFHLTVIIVLLLVNIGSAIQKEQSFVLDFSKAEELEKEQQEQMFKEDISRRLDDLIEAADVPRSAIRNIAVDAGARLKDDRNLQTDADELYKEAERLAQELKNGQKMEDARNETVDLQGSKKPKPEAEQKAYSGPSVLSWTLDGRKARSLEIPAYKCYKAGDVSVMIKVNSQGRVTDAKVIDEVSSKEECLRKYAVRAARTSLFSASNDPNHAKGEVGQITYRFIAQ